jgi:hypothetical protein
MQCIHALGQATPLALLSSLPKQREQPGKGQRLPARLGPCEAGWRGPTSPRQIRLSHARPACSLPVGLPELDRVHALLLPVRSHRRRARSHRVLGALPARVVVLRQRERWGRSAVGCCCRPKGVGVWSDATNCAQAILQRGREKCREYYAGLALGTPTLACVGATGCGA